MKYEWRKYDKQIYLPKLEPQVLIVPEYSFLTVAGQGNPNDDDFAQVIGVLYSLAYAIKMLPKQGVMPAGYFDYTVFPLEGIWQKGQVSEVLDKDKLIYTMMIRQPDFVTAEVFATALALVKKKKPHPLLDSVKLERIDDGLCVQMLHMGSYDDEPKTFNQMEEFCVKNTLVRLADSHREIYLTDARKVEQSKWKTVLRYKVKRVCCESGE